jgi:hypothetical protein
MSATEIAPTPTAASAIPVAIDTASRTVSNVSSDFEANQSPVTFLLIVTVPVLALIALIALRTLLRAR